MELEKYNKLLKQVRETAPDERVYQTVVIQPFLEDIFVNGDIQVIDTSWTSETDNHTKKYYTYPSKKKNSGSSPDIIISKNYTYYNKNKNIDGMEIYACIDVKIPGDKDIPGGYNYIHSCEQMARYLQVVDTAILTNCTEWFFYRRNDDINKAEVKSYLDKFPRIRVKKVIKRKEEIKEFVNDNPFFKELCKDVLNGSENESEECRKIITEWLIGMVNGCKQPMEFKLDKGETEIRKLERTISDLTINESELVKMYHSYVMGIDKSIYTLENQGFEINRDGGNFMVSFPEEKAGMWEEFISAHLELEYWNEYLTENGAVFLFHLQDGIKRYEVNDFINDEVLGLCERLCERLCECKFESIKRMLSDNHFYKRFID